MNKKTTITQRGRKRKANESDHLPEKKLLNSTADDFQLSKLTFR